MDYSKINKLNLLGTIINTDESGVLATADQIYDKNTGKSTQDSVKDLKEAIATINANIGNALHYVGETSTAITEGSNPANDNGEAEIDIIFYDGGSYNTTTKKYELKTHTEKHKPKSGDVVIYGQTEFIYATVEYTSLTEGTMTKSYWHELGSTGSLKALAFKDNATGSVTPAGTVASAFKGTAATVGFTSTGSAQPQVSISSKDSLSAAGVSSEGGVDVRSAVIPKATASGGNAVFNATKADIQQITGVGTLPSLTTNVSGETLQIGFSAGTLPTRAAVSVVTGGSNTVTQPTITVKPLCVAMSNLSLSVKGSTSYTPAGSVTSAFTGTAATITVK